MEAPSVKSSERRTDQQRKDKHGEVALKNPDQPSVYRIDPEGNMDAEATALI